MNLPRNLGSAARIGYVVFGVALLLAAGAGVVPGGWRWVLGVFGAIVALEGTLGF